MAFRNPIIEGEELISPGLHSNNYVENTSGWRIGADGTTQFEAVNSLTNVTAQDQISAPQFNIGEGGLIIPDGRNVKAVHAV